jgi:diguanylate cyclase (GGDEF)-like protein
MVKKFPQKFAVRQGKNDPKLSLSGKKPFLMIAALIILAVDAVGFYPRISAPFSVTIILYLALFASIYFTENRTRKSDKTFQLKVSYAVFLFFLTAVCITGGYHSDLKWSLYIIAFVLMNRRYHAHSAVFIASSAVVFIKDHADVDVSFWVLNLVMLGLAAVLFAARRENKGIREKIIMVPPDTGRKPEDFKFVVNNLINNLLTIYCRTLKAESVLFFLRNQSDEKAFDLMLSVSRPGLIVLENFSVNMREGILGNALAKNEYFSFDVKGARIPFYMKSDGSERLATIPVVLNKVIGMIAVDIKEANYADPDEIKAMMEALSRETANIMELFEINQKTLSSERRISRLYEIYEKLNLLEGKHRLINNFFSEIRSFDITGGYVAELLPDGRTFEVIETFNYPEKLKTERFDYKDDAILRYVFETGKSSVVNNVKGRNVKINFGSADADKFLVSLLRHGENIYGMVKLDKTDENTFTEFEIKTLEMIHDRIAMLLENSRLYEKIKKQALEDGLTGLTNHLTFQERLRDLIEKTDRGALKCVTLFLTDIDLFKKFNDTFGHQEGDRVLIKVADVLRKFERENPGCFAARYGGEEFVFVLPDIDIEKGAVIAEKLRKYCDDVLTGGNEKETRKINLSIGVASYPLFAGNGRELIMNSDEALYLAKHEGRNRVKKCTELQKK